MLIKRRKIYRFTLLAVVIWSAIVGGSLYSNLREVNNDALSLAMNTARATFLKDQAFRFWASKKGGVYVTPSADTPPNPYLAHLPDRDVVTTEGKQLTLMNPASMVRQMMDEYSEIYGIKGRITSIKYLNPDNKADPWEEAAIHAFEDGAEEVSELSSINGKPYLRLMRPMMMTPDCMKCHAQLGYEVGDVRGGVGVSVPLESYLAPARDHERLLATTYGGIWILGLLTIAAMTRRSQARMEERETYLAELKAANENLEKRVTKRTASLAKAKEEAEQANHAKSELLLRMQTILDNAVDGIITTTENGIVETFNPAAEKIFGYNSKEVIGRNISMLMPEPDRHHHDGHLARYKSTKIPRVIGTGRVIEGLRKDGTTFPMEIALSEMKLGNYRYFTGIVRDITERKHIEEDLLHTKEEAERANYAKSEFLSRMSHELRTPLNAIIGFGQLLETNPDQPLSEQQADNVHEILHAGHHLLALINEVLDLSRIESGRIDINLEDIVIAPVIESCVAQLQPLADQKNITVKLTLSPGCAVLADVLRLREVLINLLSNAIKYNHDGGSIQIRCMHAGENRLRISVEDSGRGIAAEALPRLFKPFERMESAYNSIEGSGIGLAISKRLVEAMQGEIGVASLPGKGSNFWFELPCGESTQALTEAQPPATPTTTDNTASGARKLLYIEDNSANLRLMQKIISIRKNIELLDADNAEDGLVIAEQQRPDLILLDINLPGMDGFEALRQLRVNPATRHIPVIAVTANAMASDIARGKSEDFAEYLIKPINVANFFDVLNRCLPSPTENPE
jgi:PAS domain S-box-containing protein